MNITTEKYWKNHDLEPSFIYSREIIKFHAKSFYFASKFLPEEKKWATYSVYAFCRFVDNMVDNNRSRSNDQILSELRGFETELRLAYEYGESEHPAIKSFIYVAKKFGIPIDYPVDLIRGVEMDIDINRYSNAEELYLFCYRVAGVVGLMMLHVLGFDRDIALDYAEKMGVAMQITNILRDIDEDAQRGRIYLTSDSMDRHGVTAMQIFERKHDYRLKNLVKEYTELAKQLYIESEKGIEHLNETSRFAISSASKIYSGILGKIEENDYNPFLGRVHISTIKKLMITTNELINK